MLSKRAGPGGPDSASHPCGVFPLPGLPIVGRRRPTTRGRCTRPETPARCARRLGGPSLLSAIAPPRPSIQRTGLPSPANAPRIKAPTDEVVRRPETETGWTSDATSAVGRSAALVNEGPPSRTACERTPSCRRRRPAPPRPLRMGQRRQPHRTFEPQRARSTPVEDRARCGDVGIRSLPYPLPRIRCASHPPPTRSVGARARKTSRTQARQVRCQDVVTSLIKSRFKGDVSVETLVEVEVAFADQRYKGVECVGEGDCCTIR